jgi:hypothetical protein
MAWISINNEKKAILIEKTMTMKNDIMICGNERKIIIIIIIILIIILILIIIINWK